MTLVSRLVTLRARAPFLALSLSSLASLPTSAAAQPELLDRRTGRGPARHRPRVPGGRDRRLWALALRVGGLHRGRRPQRHLPRRWTRSGAPIADPVQANTFTADDQRNPRVAAGRDGSFLVVWRSEEPGPDPADPSGHWVRGRKFDATGAPVAGEAYVNALNAAISGGAVRPDVAALAGGGYVVVWKSAAGGTDPGIGILARRLSAEGVPQGSPFQVNVEEALTQDYPSVATLADGGFVVVWTVPGVAIRRFAADGTPLSGQLDVNASAVNGIGTDVAVAPDGRVAVVWQEGNTEIRARLYDSTLAPLGDEFRVSDVADTDPDAPQVAPYGALGFLVIWESATGVGADASGKSVEGRLVTGVDEFAAAQEQLNTFEVDAQHQPALGGSSFWLALGWQSGDNPEELNDDAILGFGIDLCGPLFCDDFELGSTLRWPVTSPP